MGGGRETHIKASGGRFVSPGMITSLMATVDCRRLVDGGVIGRLEAMVVLSLLFDRYEKWMDS